MIRVRQAAVLDVDDGESLYVISSDPDMDGFVRVQEFVLERQVMTERGSVEVSADTWPVARALVDALLTGQRSGQASASGSECPGVSRDLWAAAAALLRSDGLTCNVTSVGVGVFKRVDRSVAPVARFDERRVTFEPDIPARVQETVNSALDDARSGGRPESADRSAERLSRLFAEVGLSSWVDYDVPDPIAGEVALYVHARRPGSTVDGAPDATIALSRNRVWETSAYVGGLGVDLGGWLTDSTAGFRVAGELPPAPGVEVRARALGGHGAVGVLERERASWFLVTDDGARFPVRLDEVEAVEP